MLRPSRRFLFWPAVCIAGALAGALVAANASPATPAGGRAEAKSGADADSQGGRTATRHVLIVTDDGDTSRVTLNVRGGRHGHHVVRHAHGPVVIDLSDLDKEIAAAVDAAVGCLDGLDGLEITAEEPDRLIVGKGGDETVIDVGEIMRTVERSLHEAFAEAGEARDEAAIAERETAIADRDASREQLRADLAQMRKELAKLREELARLQKDRSR